MASNLEAEFTKRNVKLCALSCNDEASHQGWIQDINASQSADVQFPIVADPTRAIAMLYNMLDPEDLDAAGLPMTVRSVFIVAPDKKLKLMMIYPASTGRNFDEIIRVVDSLQLAVSHSVATPVNWKDGDDCMVRACRACVLACALCSMRRRRRRRRCCRCFARSCAVLICLPRAACCARTSCPVGLLTCLGVVRTSVGVAVRRSCRPSSRRTSQASSPRASISRPCPAARPTCATPRSPTSKQ
jgi:alkyl hydroperoxide reductase subunit AhpC